MLIKWSQAQLVIAKMSQLGVDETDQGETRLLLNLNISYSRQPLFCPILPKPVKNALKFKNIISHFGVTLFFNSVRQQYSNCFFIQASLKFNMLENGLSASVLKTWIRLNSECLPDPEFQH